jgi:hypothetical protein
MTVAEIDDVLRQALSRIATDADTTGVADAIRARVAAGDTGTPASSSGFRVGFRSWLTFVGLLLIVAILGFGLGISGVFGHPLIAGSTAASTHAVAGGAPTVGATATPTPTVTSTAAAPVAPADPPAKPKPAPPKAKDTTPPALTVGNPSADTIWGIGSSCTPTSTTIATTASDAGGVASTSAVSSFGGTVIVPSGPPTASVFTVSANDPGTAPPVTVTITVTATDASGNFTTRATSFTLYPAGNCVF